jgi:hypothetical protein
VSFEDVSHRRTIQVNDFCVQHRQARNKKVSKGRRLAAKVKAELDVGDPMGLSVRIWEKRMDSLCMEFFQMHQAVTLRTVLSKAKALNEF